MAANDYVAHVLLIGVGSIGGVYLYQLQRARCFVTAVCRSNYEVVKERGFKLTSVRFGNVNYKPDNMIRTVAEASGQHFDHIVVCTKSLPDERPTLSEVLRPVLVDHPETSIVLAQNGIAIEDDISRAFPDNPIISGVVYCPAQQTAPGEIDYPEMLNLFELGTFPANAPTRHKEAAAAFASLMIAGGGGAKIHDDIQPIRWSKLLMNAAWSPICALTLCTDGDFLLTSDPFARELVWDIMLEVISLARVIGIDGVTEEVAKDKLAISLKRSESGTGREMSMLQDIRHGRHFEVEVLVGNTVRLGRAHEVPMLRLETIYALLKAREASLLR